MDNYIDFHITEEQVSKICEYFGKDESELEEVDICSLLDQIIDEL